MSRHDGVKRRGVVVATVPAWLLSPLPVLAQPAARKPRIGFLSGGTPPTDPVILRDFVEPFRQGLREQGHVDGQNITVDYRWAEANLERLPGLLAD